MSSDSVETETEEIILEEPNTVIQADNEEIELIDMIKPTMTYIAIDGVCEGLITLRDSIKKNVADTIKKLKDDGIEVIMVTGDSKKTAEYIGKEIGIDKIYSEVMPDKKARIINELKEQP